VSDDRSMTARRIGSRGSRVLSSFHGKRATLCGIVVVVGCLALTWSPLLPWLQDDSSGVTVNGLNAVNIRFGDLQGNTTQASDSSSDGSGHAPSLLVIPMTQGGTEASARHGVFVLVLGATALLIAVLALAGEAHRRRRMASDVCVLAVLALLPLLYDGISIRNATGSVGGGIVIGLLGAFVTVLGGTWMYRSLRGSDVVAGV